jgi:hypothetical protein
MFGTNHGDAGSQRGTHVGVSQNRLSAKRIDRKEIRSSIHPWQPA